MDPDDHERPVVSRRLLERPQVARVEVDGVGQEPAVQLAREVVIAAGAQVPDVLGIPGQVGLREGHELGAIPDRLVQRRKRPAEAGFAIEQDRRLLDHRDPVRGTDRISHLPSSVPRRRAGQL